MSQNKKIAVKFFTLSLFALFALQSVAAQTSKLNTLAEKYVNEADKAFDDGDVESAYKNIRGALTLTRKDGIPANVIFLAQTIYTKRLKDIREAKRYMDLVEVKADIEQFPEIENSTIKKLVAQIDAQQKKEADEEQKRQMDQALEQNQQAIEQSQQSQEKILEKIDSGQKQQLETQKQQVEAQKQQAEAIKVMNEGFKESTQATQKTSHVMMIAIFIIAGAIILITIIIVLVANRGFKHQAEQQMAYAEAFKMLARNQSQTNRLMIGGVTDLYGGGLKSAGSSRWGVDALPEPEETPEEKEEMQALAAKCEELGSKIDAATGRKNNSKNVSELVYKLAMALGLQQRESMVMFCAAMVYDAGFLAIAPDLLTKEQLSDEERAEIRGHIDKAEEYLQFVPKRYWQTFADATSKHHENMDGSGYPNGLSGEEIPQVARIIRVVDSYISMTSKRAYHKISDKESVIENLKSMSNIYDTDVVETLESIL